jgi:16S rRNA (cytosine967-C5)-methyltransferase
MVKLHKTTCLAVVQALREVFTAGKYADKVVEQTLKSNPKFGSRDRRFIAQSIYDCVRWWRLLLVQAGIESQKNEHDYWTILGVYLKREGLILPDWEEFDRVPATLQNESLLPLKVRASIPDWLDEIGAKELGTSWEKEVVALNEPAQVVLRVNTLKTTKVKLIQYLNNQGVSTSEIDGFNDVLVLNERQHLANNEAYQKGWFEIQDASSQLIADFLELTPNSTIIDACAGAGGKSLHIAARLNNSGKIIALDVESRKLDELNKRAKRGGVTNITTQTIDDASVVKTFENSADRLLLDVPCSGLGVVKRNPDTKWKLTPEFLDEIRQTQATLLDNYSIMLKPNGLMVYATCSLLPSENNKQIDAFLTRHPEFELVRDQAIFPSVGFDGFYMAALRKKS